MKPTGTRAALLITTAILLGAAGAALWGLNQSAESDRPLIDKVQEALDRDADKGAFTGRLGDFMIRSRMGEPPESTSVRCSVQSEREQVASPERLRDQELWSDVFGPEPFGLLCDDQLITVNNGTRPVDGADSVVMTYVDALPVLVLFDAPRDRIELTDIQGYPAVIEHPLEGVPFADASLAVLVRPPSDDQPGIVAYVNFAESTKVAIRLAERIIS